MDSLAAQIIVKIITQELNLDSQRVWLRDQNLKIPPDSGLFIVVGMIGARVMSNVTYMEQEVAGDPPVTTQREINRVMQEEMIQIDVFSRCNQALLRNWEVVAALQSFYSQQQQELNFFKIYRNPQSIFNSSGAEGGSNINRYSITAGAIVWYMKDKLLRSPLGDYYDDFTQRVDDENTIGTPNPLIEFEITPDTPPPP